MFQMIGAMAEFERSLIGERVRAGIDNARKKGTILGRPALRVLGPKDVIELRKLRRRYELPFRELAERFGVSVWTAHKLCQKSSTWVEPQRILST
jgi:DNA invertase Pin-like site-specific DNA recombinase